jgi:hypothetical protein
MFLFCFRTKDELRRVAMSAAALSFDQSAFGSPLQMNFRWMPPVREIPLRSSSALTERRFTAWRGRTGKRYVASVFSIANDAALGFVDVLLLAVTPSRQIIAARDSGPFGVESALNRWRDAAMSAGATEIHVHLLADGALERRRALIDLMPEA